MGVAVTVEGHPSEGHLVTIMLPKKEPSIDHPPLGAFPARSSFFPAPARISPRLRKAVVRLFPLEPLCHPYSPGPSSSHSYELV